MNVGWRGKHGCFILLNASWEGKLHDFNLSVHNCNHSGVLGMCWYSWRLSGDKWCLLQMLLLLWSLYFCKRMFTSCLKSQNARSRWSYVGIIKEVKWYESLDILQVSYVKISTFILSCFCYHTALIYSIVSKWIYYGSLLVHLCVRMFLINTLHGSKHRLPQYRSYPRGGGNAPAIKLCTNGFVVIIRSLRRGVTF